jgi:NAD+ kinase
MTAERRAVVVTHARLRQTSPVVREAVEELTKVGFVVELIDNLPARPFGQPFPKVTEGTEIVVVLGGDGTILGAAELVYGTDVPILGVNLGHVGFLAEFESFQLQEAIRRVSTHDYSIDERTLASVEVTPAGGGEPIVDWALNDMALQQSGHGRMLDVSVGVDGVEASSFSCDGVLVSTPTGSTAYAFSAGGPIIWPNVEALQLVPLAAHALFTRPLIIGAGSTFSVDVLKDTAGQACLCDDGRRTVTLDPGTRITVMLSENKLRLASLSGVPFTDRLVTKFNLPGVSLRERARLQEREREQEITKRAKGGETRQETKAKRLLMDDAVQCADGNVQNAHGGQANA